jgi:hypothetical protein
VFTLPARLFNLPVATNIHSFSSFTLQIPCVMVKRGRLGEVESLVGDCRPPPPGNPHRPTTRACVIRWSGRSVYGLVKFASYGLFLLPRKKTGVHSLRSIRFHSFNNSKNLSNLKKLNKFQYFKKSRSFFSCTRTSTVLRFGHSHSHPYGLQIVGSPPIAITSVLEE